MAEFAIRTRLRRAGLPTLAWIAYVAPRSFHWIDGGEQDPPHVNGLKRPTLPRVSRTLRGPNGVPPLSAPNVAMKHAVAPPHRSTAPSCSPQLRLRPKPLWWYSSNLSGIRCGSVELERIGPKTQPGLSRDGFLELV
jgi:hypothetical protein